VILLANRKGSTSLRTLQSCWRKMILLCTLFGASQHEWPWGRQQKYSRNRPVVSACSTGTQCAAWCLDYALPRDRATFEKALRAVCLKTWRLFATYTDGVYVKLTITKEGIKITAFHTEGKDEDGKVMSSFYNPLLTGTSVPTNHFSLLQQSRQMSLFKIFGTRCEAID
jgi:hypothetical protein